MRCLQYNQIRNALIQRRLLFRTVELIINFYILELIIAVLAGKTKRATFSHDFSRFPYKLVSLLCTCSERGFIVLLFLSLRA